MDEGKSKQTEYNQTWENKSVKSKAYSSYLKSRSSCKSFIRNHATTEDLEEIEQVVKERRSVLAAKEI